ncbi:MAG: carbohydrate kinase family protein [Caldilineaceae bacterium]|nr:carbohydrate kinase family protein [Caldilineaceae bacterium]
MPASSPLFDILTLGEINVDLILGHDARPIFGQFEKVVDDATLTVGGSGTIFAMGAARLGLRVAYCGVVGEDTFGRFMLDHLHQRQIDTRGVIIDPTLKTGLSVILNVPNDRAILTHLGAIDALRADQVDAKLLAQCRHIHITSYFLQHNLRPGLAALLAQTRAGGATVSLDTNWDPSERWDDGLHEVLAQTDLFLPNEQEARAITRTSTLDAALSTLASTIPTVAIKNGAAGAICRQGNQIILDPGFPMPVVDTTGAGDSFNGGFLYGWLHRWQLADALALGCACGALSTQAAGGTAAQPTLAEAQALIEQRKSQLL